MMRMSGHSVSGLDVGVGKLSPFVSDQLRPSSDHDPELRQTASKPTDDQNGTH